MKTLFSFLFVATALTLASCSKKAVNSDEAANRLVAGEAPAVIFSVKAKDLLDKGGISNKENVPAMFQMLFSDKVEYFTNPEKAGLDLSGKSYMTVSSNGDKNHNFWALTKISNKETFEKMLKEEGNDKFEEVEGFNTVKMDSKAIMAWNDHLLLMVGSSEGKAMDKFKAYAEMLKSDKTAGDQYKEFFASNTDLAFYNDMGQFANLHESMPNEIKGGRYNPEVMKKLAEKLKGSYGMTTVDFENDKIVADVVNHLSEAAKKEFSFIGNTGFPKELLAQLGPDELTGFFTLNTDVQKLVQWVSDFSGEDMLTEAREKSGMDVDRILASFKGNLLMAFQGTIPVTFDSYDEEGKMVPDTMMIPRTTVIGSISTDGYLEKLADSLLKEQKEGSFYAIKKSFNPQYLGFKPGVAVFTNDASILSKTGAPAIAPEAEKVLDKPFAFYFDIRALIMANGKDMQGMADKFKYAVGGMDINGGHAEMLLNNGGKNSLWTLINITVESTTDMMPQM